MPIPATPTATRRPVHNFSGGPGALPAIVTEQAAEALREVPEVGLPLLGISHRSAWFRGVVDEAEALIRDLAGLPPDFHVLFLQGGSTLQFSQIPMNFLRGRPAAQYLHTGYWSGKALAEARREGAVDVVWSGEAEGFRRLPADDELRFADGAAYVHYVSNETVEGLQFHRVPGRGDAVRICDASADFLSAPLAMDRIGLLYAHAQKNLGAAGVTVVLIRDGWMRGGGPGLPTMLDYRVQAAAHSLHNTPPVFAIYVALLALRWLRDDIGGVAAMARINAAKAAAVYAAIDGSGGFYRSRVAPADRSRMNAVFTAPTPELDRRLVAEAAEEGLVGLDGHRSIGGLRASLYNPVTPESAAVLAEFLRDFARRRG